ncbi:acyl-CoA dehydrogenase family protein [Microbaculum sp. FT89]|uniref:acyl-CoA dehydrogenase family protein n=1 Tax=Microbaculum sp. FT89 TaxID=3447298 RepID=UPI003F53A20E
MQPTDLPQADTDDIKAIREAVRGLCARFPGEYWRKLDRDRAYPTQFVEAMTEGGFLSVLVPTEYGGSGLNLTAAVAILEEVHASGGNGAACHAQMYTMGTLLRHGAEEQKRRYLPAIASGELRLQAFGVTEPTAGTDTLSIRTTASRDGDHYVVNGQKVWTSRAEHSDLMILLARTTPKDKVEKRTEGLSVFLVDMREAPEHALRIRPIETMINHATTEVFFEGLRIPAENRIGEEGKGLRYILDGMNAERILIAAECLGDARWFLDKATAYARDRVVFGRPIGQNQGVQFPIARNYVEFQAARLMVYHAAAQFDAGEPAGEFANMAKLAASEASWHAADTCLQTHGGFGFATDFDVERKFRETRLYQVAPISTNLILSYVAEHVLKLPRSY